MFKSEKEIVSDFLHIVLWSITVIFIVAFVIISKQIADNNHFADFSSQVISRYGGLTTQAKIEIEEYNQALFEGRYILDSDTKEITQFGTLIEYSVKTNLKVLYFEIPINLEFQGITTSKVRK